MNLNTVKAASLCSCGGLAECPDKIMYLLNSQSAGNVGLGRLLERRGSNGVCVIYYQRDNLAYPIEVQLWCGKDYYFNLWSHQYVYKYKSSEIGQKLY